MGEVVRLAEYREKSAFEEGSRLWRLRFKAALAPGARLNDLEGPVLCQLAEPSELNNEFLYSMILSFLGYGRQASFSLAPTRIQIEVVDIHLFLSDHLRFEMMRRLGWLARFCATQYPLFEMVRQFNQIRILCQQDPPSLSETHARYPEYQSMIGRDQQVLIRQLLPSALEAFKKKLPA